MSVILREMNEGSYYAGQNKKYHDMIDVVPDASCAKVFDTNEEAQGIIEKYRKAGYDFSMISIT